MFKDIVCYYEIRIQEASSMLEYRVESYRLANAEEGMNYMAAVGWRVVSVVQNSTGLHYELVVVYEREAAY